jgi:threonine/homoserine/homoserine lactone efflux protein
MCRVARCWLSSQGSRGGLDLGGVRAGGCAGVAADDPVVMRTGGGGRLTAFRTGMVTNLANPKAAVLYLALLPQFLPAGGGTLADTAVLAAVQMAISVSWYTLVVLAVGLVRRTLARPSVKARVEQISGLVLVGLGLRMITLSRAAL